LHAANGVGAGEWAAPMCEGRWGHGDVVVAITLHKFRLEEKRKEKKRRKKTYLVVAN